jgi:uroporphyrinogen-III synthase
MIIFISPTAVHKSLPALQSHWQKIPEQIQIMAVGSGTAAALAEYNIHQVYYPEQNFGSEGLLTLPLLKNVKDKQIAIIKGTGGRELLSETLSQRGAIIEEVAVYQRGLPSVDTTLLVNEWRYSGIDIIICTSEQSLNNFLILIGADAKQWLLQQLLLVSSERLLQIASSYGFIRQPLLAKNASDEALLSALKHWRGKQNG